MRGASTPAVSPAATLSGNISGTGSGRRRLPRLPVPTWSGPRLCRGVSRGVGLFFSWVDPQSSIGAPETFGTGDPDPVGIFDFQPRLFPLFPPRLLSALRQLLYNPHLQAPLGSAGNKGLITPLESALTEKSPVTSLESALTKRRGEGHPLPFARPHFFLPRYVVTCNRIQVLSFHTLPHSFAFAQNPTLLFSIDSALFAQNTQEVVSIMVPSLKKKFDFPAPRYSQGRGGWDYSLRV